jgi:hypothetical protein
LALLEQKPGALDQAAPLAGWQLPGGFGVLRGLLEARLGKAGKREFVQVLRLLEAFRRQHEPCLADAVPGAPDRDRRMLRLFGKRLKAGMLEEGPLLAVERG